MNSAKYFGTDGLRGKSPNGLLTPEFTLRLGKAMGYHLGNSGTVVIATDTRSSCHLIESALCSGLNSVGVSVISMGTLPTPGLSYIVSQMPNVHLGIMVSASHNPVSYNGIKVLGNDGMKISEDTELKIESLLDNHELEPSHYRELGRNEKDTSLADTYVQHLKKTFSHLNLNGWHIAMDCANGASYAVAPKLFRDLGAKVDVINDKPDGNNINAGCGSTHPEIVANLVRETGAHMGVSFDGDADRVICTTAQGGIVSGDDLLAVCALHMKNKGTLNKNSVVTTVMSNSGLEKSLKNAGISMVRTAVGDKHVLQALLDQGISLGGEESGHVIFRECGNMGDGIVSALKLLEVLQETGTSLEKATAFIETYPQIMKNVHTTEKIPLSSMPQTTAIINHYSNEIQGRGAILVRYSGTEELLRIMVEGEDMDEIQTIVSSIEQTYNAEKREM